MRSPVYTNPDTDEVFYRASALGHCLVDLVAYRRGMVAQVVPKWLQEAFDAGSAAEEGIITHARSLGYEVINEQKEIAEEVFPGIYVIGHIDGETEQFVIEAKNFAQSTIDKWNEEGLEGFPHYKIQASVYVLLREKEGVKFFIRNKKTEEIDQYFFRKEDLYDWAEIKERIALVEAHYAEETWPEVTCASRDYCAFEYQRKALQTVEVRDAEWDKLVGEYKEAKEQVEKYKSDQEKLAEKLKAYIDEHGYTGKYVESEQWTVKDTIVSRETLDRDKLATVVKLSDYMKPSAQARYIKLHPAGKNEKSDE